MTFGVSQSGSHHSAPTLNTERSASTFAGNFNGLSFLIVDDIATNRLVLRTLLAGTGARVTEACDGAEALKAMEPERFDVVFLDVHMPELTGPEVLAAMRSDPRLEATPTIVTTADAMIGDREGFLEMGMDGYVSKPIDARLLFAETARVLKQKSAG